jgi:hypothetical protein
MSDMLGDALAWLGGKRHDYMSVSVTYRRGYQSASVFATRGRTAIDVGEVEGMKSRAFETDFIFRASDLVFDGSRFDPQRGDRIIEGDNTFEVMPINDELWRWCDPQQVDIRVHVKLVDDDNDSSY